MMKKNVYLSLLHSCIYDAYCQETRLTKTMPSAKPYKLKPASVSATYR